jgi:hypothetical protein
MITVQAPFVGWPKKLKTEARSTSSEHSGFRPERSSAGAASLGCGAQSSVWNLSRLRGELFEVASAAGTVDCRM